MVWTKNISLNYLLMCTVHFADRLDLRVYKIGLDRPSYIQRCRRLAAGLVLGGHAFNSDLDHFISVTRKVRVTERGYEQMFNRRFPFCWHCSEDASRGNSVLTAGTSKIQYSSRF